VNRFKPPPEQRSSLNSFFSPSWRISVQIMQRPLLATFFQLTFIQQLGTAEVPCSQTAAPVLHFSSTLYFNCDVKAYTSEAACSLNVARRPTLLRQPVVSPPWHANCRFCNYSPFKATPTFTLLAPFQEQLTATLRAFHVIQRQQAEGIWVLICAFLVRPGYFLNVRTFFHSFLILPSFLPFKFLLTWLVGRV
jgi:hypothetical protein